MLVENHPLALDFPEFKDAIHSLKMDNAHFVKLSDEYHETDKAIGRAENGIDNLGDAVLEDMKKVRMQLKDQLFDMLKTQAEAAPEA